MALFVFCASLFLLVYSFWGYPILLSTLAAFKSREIIKKSIFPTVTIIIPVYNEETAIGPKIENCLEFDYPDDKLNIIVVSDASTDNTENVVKDFNLDRVRFLSLASRGGKVVAQNFATRFCHSEIVIFTDVAILTDSRAVKNIVENFVDESIGAVSCRDVIVGNDHASRGEKNYIRYDMMVRQLTSRIGSLIGVTGGFYAARFEIVHGGWNPAFPPDFYVAIRCMKKGLRVIEDSRVKARYKTAAKEWDELERKVRTINRGMHALLSKPNRALLNPFQYKFIALQLFSHKLLRWLVPFLLLSIFFSNWLLIAWQPVLRLLFFFQVLFYSGAILSVVLNLEAWLQLKLLRYFSIANIAILKAWFEFLMGKKYVFWQPTKR
jgi:glycosyltransferase involved in cell wall biosynthesis